MWQRLLVDVPEPQRLPTSSPLPEAPEALLPKDRAQKPWKLLLLEALLPTHHSQKPQKP